MGSFVQPGEEHLTTNIFAGNLAPSITEEQMTDLFRQFGEDIRHHRV
jgi:U2-associated protein SR140